MKRILCLLLGVMLLCGCGAAPAEPTTEVTTTAPTAETELETIADAQYTVGLCLPEKNEKWTNVVRLVNKQLISLKCATLVRYAENNPATQAEQISTLVRDGVDGLIVTAIDSLELLEALEEAKQANIPVVAYEELLMNTDAVSAFVGIDYRQVGREMGNYIEQTKMLEVAADTGEQYTIEFLMGPSASDRAVQLYQGVMEVLDKYFRLGILTCPSGRYAFEDCCIPDWDMVAAKTRFEKILKENYTEAPDIICTADDRFVANCLQAMNEAGIAGWPLITGFGGNDAALSRVQNGEQALTVLPETEVPAEPLAQMIYALMTGTALPVDDATRNNLVKDVPAWFAMAEVIVE